MAYKSRFLYLDDTGDFREGMAGGVFITDVSAVHDENVVKVTRTPDIPVVDSVESDTTELVVTVEWDGSAYTWRGDVTVNGSAVSNITEIGVTRRFTGTVNVTLPVGTDELTAIHSDGAVHKVPVTMQEAGPVITDVKFVGGYPSGQTEVKAGDVVTLEVTFDGSGSVPTHVEVMQEGALVHDLVPVVPVGNKATINVTIAPTSNAPQDLTGTVRARNAFGTFGAKKVTSNTIKCNDQAPAITVSSISYPASQGAIKDSESATVNITTSNADSLETETPTGQLTEDSHDFGSVVVHRTGGDYNISTPNLIIKCTKTSNGATVTLPVVVNIAHVDPEIVVTEPVTRFQSSPSGEDYTITMTSNQQLSEIPTLTCPEGDLSVLGGTVPGTVFTATLNVKDSHQKGTYNWGAVHAKNLAGKVVTTLTDDTSYTLGGFTERDIHFAPQSKEAPLGVYVSDVNKLVAVDKDLIAMEYKNNLDNAVRGFSITDPSNVHNPQGNILFWNDEEQVQNNTTGLSFIRIREDV